MIVAGSCCEESDRFIRGMQTYNRNVRFRYTSYQVAIHVDLLIIAP